MSSKMDKEALNITKGNEHPEEWQQPPVDKEAQEKIADILYEILGGDSDFDKEAGCFPMADFCDERADEILKALSELGYRKLPEGQPPLLRDEEINKHVDSYTKESRSLWESGKDRTVKIDEAMSLDSVYQRIAQAQRKADIDWYGGQQCP